MAAQDLCTLQDVREFMDYPDSDTSQDAKIAGLITRASDTIIEECSREFAPESSTTTTRRFRVKPEVRNQRGLYVVNLAPYDLQASATATVKLHPETSDPVTLTKGTDWIGNPEPSRDGVYTELLLSAGPGNVILTSDSIRYFGHAYLDVEGTWGFPNVPSRVVEAAVVTVASWMRRDVSQFANADTGDGQMPPAAPSYGLPPAARRLISRFVRQVWF